MGLFSLFQLPPDPVCSFNLDSRGPFGPGSPVSGALTLLIPPDPKAKTQPPPRQLKAAAITFYGRAATANTREESSGTGDQRRTRTIYYEDDVCLFRHCYVLITNISVDETKPLESRFGFSFPWTADPLPIPTPYEERRSVQGNYVGHAEARQQQPLPPSFRMEISSSTYAIFEYNIELVCHFEGEKTPFTVTLPIPLGYLPPPSYPSSVGSQPSAEYVKAPRRYSSSRLIGTEKSISRSFRDKFSSNTPAVDVVLKVALPATLTPGSAFPIYACMEVLNPSTSEVSLPVAELNVKSLRWHRQVFFRALRNQHRRSHMGEHEDSRTTTTSLNTLPENQWIDPRENIPTGDKSIAPKSDRSWYYPATFEARIPGDTDLSIRTRNIDCGYAAELKFVAELCGKEFEFKVEAGVLILPGGTMI